MRGPAALLAGFGLVIVAFGLLSALLALFDPVADLDWIVGNLALGVMLLCAALFMAFDRVRDWLHAGSTRRAGKYGGSALFSTFLAISILAMLGFLAERYPQRFDWSEQKVNTLTDQSLGLLRELSDPVRLRAFFRRSDRPEASALLERYAYASDRVDVDYVDPNSVPALVEDLALDPDLLARGLVRVEVGGEGLVVTEFEEEKLTNALLKLVRGGGKKVYFSSGHNERLIATEKGGAAEGKESVGRAVEALRNETYEVESLALASQGEVPEDADALIITGPTRPFFEHELSALRRYQEAGGALLVMIDPRARTNLYPLLAEWGVQLGDDVVVDRKLALFGQATSPFAGGYAPEHPITAKLRETTIFPMVRSVEALAGGVFRFESLVQTSADSWAERDLDGWQHRGRAVFDEGDLDGPVTIAVAGRPRPPGVASAAHESRLVVFGDSDFISNEFIDSFRNRDLFLNSVNWLLGDVEQISLRPHRARASRFRLDQAQFRRLRYLSLFVLPETIAMLGVVAWWLRREKGAS